MPGDWAQVGGIAVANYRQNKNFQVAGATRMDTSKRFRAPEMRRVHLMMMRLTVGQARSNPGGEAGIDGNAVEPGGKWRYSFAMRSIEIGS
jgi:hypothetical protein